MAPHPFFNPIIFSIEFVYTAIIVILCYLIYHKTKEIYELTKHKGIHFFRNTFIFFGLAYVARFVLDLFFIASSSLDLYAPRRMFQPLMMIPVGYLSTMALFYLIYSQIWKKIEHRNFLIISNVTAIIFSVLAFFTRSPFVMSLLQLILLAIGLVVAFATKKKKLSKIKVLYLLMIFFWIINLISLSPGREIPLQIKIALQILSVLIFVLVYYRVHKWIK